ncbi:hypothetical protein ACFQ60_20405 [Streptomyces zhihengii]
MLIEGYDPESDDPLVAGEDLLTLPGFWLCHLGCSAPPARAPRPSAPTRPTPTPRSRRSWTRSAGPSSGSPSAAGTRRWCSTATSTTTRVWSSSSPTGMGGRLGHLGTIDGHPSGPGLAWPELLHIAHTPDASAPGVQDPHARLLLLLPALGDADLPDEAAPVVAAALTATGTLPDGAPALASTLLAHHPYWSPASWALPSASPLSGATAPGRASSAATGPSARATGCASRRASAVRNTRVWRWRWAPGRRHVHEGGAPVPAARSPL